ncbi:hypothetical protein BV898_17622 [Hypsibius exemplaris]|uniref:non-specific serine/threonine protein kinase n=1 Tax=Hypsibius exemplaris TaxID=2072580 RepID=A0A9X6NHK7_HYPEX|nr:hypothetical protein BV898_17622 [Hypsibius exemplaris]
MVEIGKGDYDIFFKDSYGFDNICRPTADDPYLGYGRFSRVIEVNAFHLDPDPVTREGHAGTYALKTLYGKASSDDGRTEELETLLHLQHEHVIRYFAVGTRIDRSQYCILMEFCSGMTLNKFINGNTMYCSTDVIVNYAIQLASGLRYLHEKTPTKFLHGGIISDNILMKDTTGKILKIADLDSSFQRRPAPRSSEKLMRGRGRLTYTSPPMSKENKKIEKKYYEFMSPEMIAWQYGYDEAYLAYLDGDDDDDDKRNRRPPWPGSSSDIWSLGYVVLDMYRVRMGQFYVFPISDFQPIWKGLPVLFIPEDMPDELKVLADHCLKVNPDDRPTAATLLKYADRVYFKCGNSGIQYYVRPSSEDLGHRGEFGTVQSVNAFCVGANFQDEGPRRLALKTFRYKLDEDEIAKIQTLPKLKHGNIVKYLTTGYFDQNTTDQDPRYRLIMEWCSGGTLTEAAAETALPVEKQKNYLNQLICGIHFLHNKNNPSIVHKDLKGMNVIFSDENKIMLKICDVDSCSVSRKVEQQSVISRVRFTPGFVSPELLKWATMFNVTGDYPVGRATDIWSLGAVVLEMYCRGKLPDIPSFQRGDILRITAVADANVDTPPIGEELLAFAAKCLVNEPGDRPGIEQLRDDFSKG